jgi:hypothetical protein
MNNHYDMNCHIYSETKLRWIRQMVKDYLNTLDYYTVPPSSDDANTIADWADSIAQGVRIYEYKEFFWAVVYGHDDIRVSEFAKPIGFPEKETE